MSIAMPPDQAAPTSSVSLVESYAHCARLARKAASSFYLSFWLLPAEKRCAMCALYAFLRRADDIGDDGSSLETRRAELNAWRASLEHALASSFNDSLMPALTDTVRRFAIPHPYLFDALDGVAMDLEDRHYETAADLESYCYRVASVVGLSCIHIWGFRGDDALEPARRCGLAFQWTNILRDLGEDAARGRIYLPRETLRRHRYEPGELLSRVADDRLAAIIADEVKVARSHFTAAAALQDYLSRDGRRVFAAMYGTYRDLLDRVERAGVAVLERRVRVPTWRKVELAARALLSSRGRVDSEESARR